MGITHASKTEPQHRASYDIIIIGAGIVGCMLARELSRYKGRFALLDKEAFTGFGVSKANPCMLHSPLLFPSGPLRIRLAHKAAARYKRLAHDLDVTFKEVDEIASMVGDTDIRLTLTKGTMVILDKTASHLVQNMVYGTYDRDHSQLITPTTHGNLLIGLGSFDTPRHKNDTTVTREKLAQVIQMGQELVPAVKKTDVITAFAGIRSQNNKAAEQVAKAEILQAISRGADTMDAIKHVTRAGMGRCQGGFCGPTILNCLAEALGLTASEITKKGFGSNQIAGPVNTDTPY